MMFMMDRAAGRKLRARGRVAFAASGDRIGASKYNKCGYILLKRPGGTAYTTDERMR